MLALLAGLWVIGTGNTVRGGRAPDRLARDRGALDRAARATSTGRSPDSGHDLALHFLDVGQGDAAAVRTPGGHWVVIDAGPAGGGADAGRRVVAPFLARPGRATGGRGVRVPRARRSSRRSSGRPADGLARAGGRTGDLLHRSALSRLSPPAGGAAHRLASRSLRRMFPARRRHRSPSFIPAATWTRWGEDINEDSLVLLVEYGGFQALFAGDAGFPAEEALGPIPGAGRSAEGGSSREPGQHRNRLSRAAEAEGRGHLGGAERVRSPGAGYDGAPGLYRSRWCGGPTGMERCP